MSAQFQLIFFSISAQFLLSFSSVSVQFLLSFSSVPAQFLLSFSSVLTQFHLNFCVVWPIYGVRKHFMKKSLINHSCLQPLIPHLDALMIGGSKHPFSSPVKQSFLPFFSKGFYHHLWVLSSYLMAQKQQKKPLIYLQFWKSNQQVRQGQTSETIGTRGRDKCTVPSPFSIPKTKEKYFWRCAKNTQKLFRDWNQAFILWILFRMSQNLAENPKLFSASQAQHPESKIHINFDSFLVILGPF